MLITILRFFIYDPGGFTFFFSILVVLKTVVQNHVVVVTIAVAAVA